MTPTVRYWVLQRVTAIALIPLGLWFMWSFAPLLAAPYEEAVQWLQAPFPASCAALLMLTLFYHGALGMQVIWEDYIKSICLRTYLINLTFLLSALGASVSVGAILFVYYH